MLDSTSWRRDDGTRRCIGRPVGLPLSGHGVGEGSPLAGVVDGIVGGAPSASPGVAVGEGVLCLGAGVVVGGAVGLDVADGRGDDRVVGAR